MTRQLFFVRENNTNTWCVSSRHATFWHDFDCAVVFLRKENAEKAIKEMMIGLDPKRVTSPPIWRADDMYYTPLPEYVSAYTTLMSPDFEAIAFNLSEVIE